MALGAPPILPYGTKPSKPPARPDQDRAPGTPKPIPPADPLPNQLPGTPYQTVKDSKGQVYQVDPGSGLPIDPNYPLWNRGGPTNPSDYLQPGGLPNNGYGDTTPPPPGVDMKTAMNTQLNNYLEQLMQRHQTGQVQTGNLAANSLADQYDAWLRGTQSRASGALTTNSLLTNSLNGINNRALSNSANTQLALNNEARFRNGLDMKGLGLSNNLVNTNLGLAAEQRNADVGRIKGQWALRNGQFVADQDYIQGIWGRANTQLGADQANMARLAGQAQLGYGYAAADLENATNRANLQEDTNRRAATSQAAGAGAFGSAGFRDNQADIKELAGLSRDSAWNTYEQQRDATTGALGDISFNRGQLDRNYQGDIAGYQKQLGDNSRNYQGDILNYQYGLGQVDRDYRGTTASLQKQLADNSLAKQALESIARGYGIQDKDIISTLQTATERNNINTAQLLADMNQAYEQGNADRISQFNQMMYQLIGAVPSRTTSTTTRGTVNPMIR